MTIISCKNGIVQSRNNIVSFNGSMSRGKTIVEEKPKDLIADETKTEEAPTTEGAGFRPKKLNRFISLKL
jgi:hypothetical protein